MGHHEFGKEQRLSLNQRVEDRGGSRCENVAKVQHVQASGLES